MKKEDIKVYLFILKLVIIVCIVMASFYIVIERSYKFIKNEIVTNFHYVQSKSKNEVDMKMDSNTKETSTEVIEKTKEKVESAIDKITLESRRNIENQFDLVTFTEMNYWNAGSYLRLHHAEINILKNRISSFVWWEIFRTCEKNNVKLSDLNLDKEKKNINQWIKIKINIKPRSIKNKKHLTINNTFDSVTLIEKSIENNNFDRIITQAIQDINQSIKTSKITLIGNDKNEQNIKEAINWNEGIILKLTLCDLVTSLEFGSPAHGLCL